MACLLGKDVSESLREVIYREHKISPTLLSEKLLETAKEDLLFVSAQAGGVPLGTTAERDQDKILELPDGTILEVRTRHKHPTTTNGGTAAAPGLASRCIESKDRDRGCSRGEGDREKDRLF